MQSMWLIFHGVRRGEMHDFHANRTGARSNYRLVRAGAQVQHSVTPKWSVGWRVDGQWAMTPLVPAEQFGSGGASTVRGYHERSLNTDSGVNTSGNHPPAKPGAFGM